MEDRELETLLIEIESDRVERKVALTHPDRIGQAMCAFANDLPGHDCPGVLFLGAYDDGSCAGTPITDVLLQTLAAYRSDGNILPPPSLVVQKRTLRGCELAVVIIQPSDAPPVRYKGVVWIRVGPRRGIATAQDERRLSERRRARDLPFDARPIPGTTLADLDLEFFRKSYLPSSVDPEILARNERTIEQQLASTRFATVDVPPTATGVGLLAIGKDPKEFLGGAYIQFLRIDGRELADPIRDEKRITGPVSEMLRRVDEVVEAHVTVGVDITSARIESRRPDYPIAALQQVIRNAVMHRNYEGTNAPVRITWFSDRIEVTSPGGPYGHVTPENFGQPGLADYRNRHLAEVMYNLGYVQRFGVGLQITRREMDRNGNPPPEFDAQTTYVQVTLRRRP